MVLPELRNLRLSTGKTVQELAQVLNVDESIDHAYQVESRLHTQIKLKHKKRCRHRACSVFVVLNLFVPHFFFNGCCNICYS